VLLTDHEELPINLPDEILDAQENGELVIFAGAGISIQSPSNMLSFKDLAYEICKEFNTNFDENYLDKIDIFLGKLSDKHLDVHGKVQEIIRNIQPQPNDLHNSIVKLFNNKKEIKIITTNFDDLLTKSAESYFESKIGEYNAPALPLGYNFSGIVYLHGNINSDPKQMVLIDSDFGKAYMTEGWARRFLQQVFQRYVVLFIGYSHNDLLMKYFSRGLAVEVKQRYSLACADKAVSWQNLRIIPIKYPRGEKDRKYFSLHKALRYWAKLTQLDYFGHQKRLREIIEIGPLADKRSISYLVRSLNKISYLKYFTQNALKHEWIEWARDNGKFDSLFTVDRQNETIRTNIWSNWFVKNSIIENSDFGFETFINYEYKMNSILFNEIQHYLSTTKESIDPTLIGKWVNVLRYVAVKSFSSYWGMSRLFLKTRPDQDLATSCILLEILTSPLLKPVKSFGIRSEKIEWKPQLLGESHTFESLLKKIEQNIQDYAEKLCFIVSNNMLLLYETLKSIGQSWDPISFHRSAVEKHEQDRYREEFDPIIDILKLSIEYFCNNKIRVAEYYINIWSGSESLILKRIAIYGMTINRSAKSKSKMNWLLEEDYLFEYGLKHEVFRLIEECFSKLTEDESNEFAQSVIGTYYLKRGDGEDEDKYELYNILIWMNDVNPECQTVKSKLADIKAKHPDWKKREYPDLDFYSSTSTAEFKSPVSVEELTSKKPEEWIGYICNYKGGDTFREPDRQGLLEILACTCSQNPQWGTELFKVLKENHIDKLDIINALYQGFKDALFQEKHWRTLFDVIIEKPEFAKPNYYLSWLIRDGMEDSKKKIPHNLLDKAEVVSDIIWKTKDTDDWGDLNITSALNHYGGKITLFWLYALSDRNQAENFNSIPEEYKNRFKSIIQGESKKDIFGKMYLGSQLPFLLSLDKEWSYEQLLPLFDFTKYPAHARFVWEGYLLLCSFHPHIVQSLLSLYPPAIEHIENGSDIRASLLKHIAYIILFCDQSNHENGTVLKLISKLIIDSERANIVSTIQRETSSLDTKSKENLWRRWLKNYWLNRSKNVPVDFGEKEKLEFIILSLEFDSRFDECFEIIKGYSSLEFDDRLFFGFNRKTDITISHPNEFGKFLIHILKLLNIEIPIYYCDDLNELAIKLHKSKCKFSILKELCAKIKEKGCDLNSDLEKLFI
jgi:SIR2-like domain